MFHTSFKTNFMYNCNGYIQPNCRPNDSVHMFLKLHNNWANIRTLQPAILDLILFSNILVFWQQIDVRDVN